MLFVLMFLLGCVVIEAVGTQWHHKVAHMGLFGNVLSWMLQGRHYHHHAVYHKDRLTDEQYRKSCELTFHPMGVLLVLVLIGVGLLGVAWWLYLVVFFVGSLTWGVAVLGKLHDLYHVDEDVVRKMWLFRSKPIFAGYLWLRDYHHIHHLLPEYNTAIVLFMFDKAKKTFLHPRYLQFAKATAVPINQLFPNFDVKKTSWCGKWLW